MTTSSAVDQSDDITVHSTVFVWFCCRPCLNVSRLPLALFAFQTLAIHLSLVDYVDAGPAHSQRTPCL